MNNLYILNEIFTDGYSHFLLNLISISSALCGIFVIISKNPIVSILFLIGLFFSIASYLMMLGMNFIGLSYLLVYVGAVSILFLFILMLINIRVSELITDNNNSIPLGIFIGIVFVITLHKLLPSNLYNVVYTDNISKKTSNYFSFVNDNNLSRTAKNIFNNETSFVTSQIWDGSLAETSHITSIGNILYTGYPLWLIITSIVLLLAMVGAIIITIKQ